MRKWLHLSRLMFPSSTNITVSSCKALAVKVKKADKSLDSAFYYSRRHDKQ